MISLLENHLDYLKFISTKQSSEKKINCKMSRLTDIKFSSKERDGAVEVFEIYWYKRHTVTTSYSTYIQKREKNLKFSYVDLIHSL